MRAALGWSARQWAVLSPLERSAWHALSASGSDGLGVLCGHAVVQVAIGPIPGPTPPAALAPGAPVLLSASVFSNVLFIEVSNVGLGADRLDFFVGAPRPSADFAAGLFVRVDTSLDPTPATFGMGSYQDARWGAAPSGWAIPAFGSSSTSGLRGPPSNVVWALAP